MHFRQKKNQVHQFRPKEYRHIIIMRIMSILAIGIFALMFAWVVLFIYQNVFITIGSVDTLLNTNATLRIEPIDFNKLEKIQARWDEKHSPTSTPLARDPFAATAAPATISTTTSNPVITPQR